MEENLQEQRVVSVAWTVVTPMGMEILVCVLNWINKGVTISQGMTNADIKLLPQKIIETIDTMQVLLSDISEEKHCMQIWEKANKTGDSFRHDE